MFSFRFKKVNFSNANEHCIYRQDQSGLPQKVTGKTELSQEPETDKSKLRLCFTYTYITSFKLLTFTLPLNVF